MDEWAAVDVQIEPAKMPFFSASATVIDRVFPQMQTLRAELADYARAELICYRASDDDAELLAHQRQHWDSWLDWMQEGLHAVVLLFILSFFKLLGRYFLGVMRLCVLRLPEFSVEGFDRLRDECHERSQITQPSVTLMCVNGVCLAFSASFAASSTDAGAFLPKSAYVRCRQARSQSKRARAKAAQ